MPVLVRLFGRTLRKYIGMRCGAFYRLFLFRLFTVSLFEGGFAPRHTPLSRRELLPTNRLTYRDRATFGFGAVGSYRGLPTGTSRTHCRLQRPLRCRYSAANRS